MKYIVLFSLLLSACGSYKAATLSSSLQQKEIFADTASSIVACYLEKNIMIKSLQEDTMCGNEALWLMKSDSKASYQLSSFDLMSEPGAFGPDVGRYVGSVSFTGLMDCTFALDFTYSGEDISGSVSGFQCK